MNIHDLEGKTLVEAQAMLQTPITRILVDRCGIYKPKLHEKRYGQRIIKFVCDWSDNTIYAEIF